MAKQLPYYERDGVRYDRITHILDYFPAPELVDWKIDVGRKEARRISTVATNIGTNVDEAIKADILGHKIPKLKTDEAKSCYEAYQQWRSDYGYQLSIPNTVFNEALLVAGTPDIHTVAHGGGIIDIKCSREIRDAYWLQTEFYSRTTPLDVEWKAILRLDKNLGVYEFKKVPLSDFDWEATVSAIKLYRFYNKVREVTAKEAVC